MCHNFVGYQAITEQLQKSAKNQTFELYAKNWRYRTIKI